MSRKINKINVSRVSRAAAAAIAALLVCGFWVSAAPPGYENRRLWLANQPDRQSPYVKYYIDGKEQPASKINWVAGRGSGKAVSLSGKGEYLELGYYQLQVHTMTIAGWFYWRGAAEGMERETMHSQRFFTFSRNKDVWLSVMPHSKKRNAKHKDGGVLDGVYMAFSMGSGKEKVFYEFFNPATPGKTHYGIPTGEWHHIALTMNARSLCLYIDGQLWFERMLILGVEEMRNNRLRIGAGIWDEPTLNAVIDDLAIYSFAMSAEQVKMLYHGIDPQEKGATLPPPTQPSLPEPPSQDPSDIGGAEEDGTILGLPSWTVCLAAALLAVFVVLSVIFSVRKPDAGETGDGKGGASQ